jgi:hypothetical protein
MFNSYKKKSLVLLLLVMVFAITVFPAFAQSGNVFGEDVNEQDVSITPAFAQAYGGGGGNEDYYRAVSQLILSTWDDSFFGAATLSIGGDMLEVDHHLIKLDNPAEIRGGELILPAKVLRKLGVEVSYNADGASVKKNNKSVEVVYGEKAMLVNGKKMVLPAAAVMQGGNPALPASVLTDQGLGFQVEFNEATGKIIITDEYQMARVIAKVEPGKQAPQNIKAAQAILGPDGLVIYQFENKEEAIKACAALNAADSIVYAEPDRLVILDAVPAYAEQGGCFDADEDAAPITRFGLEAGLGYALPGLDRLAAYPHLSWGPERIGADEYLDYLLENDRQNSSVIVAVIDTGIDPKHSIFSGRYMPGYNMIAANNNGADDHGHGTHVAGTVLDVTIAIPGIKVMPVKVLNSGGIGANLNVANGIRWAADNNAAVINMSLGGGHSDAVDDAVAYATGKNITTVVAAGNDFGDTKNVCPAHIADAITVAACDSSDRLANFTNFGSAVDVTAPGVDIVSAWLGGGTYAASGTSMASPHAAGAAALLLATDASLTPKVVQMLIRQSVDPWTSPGYDIRYGAGILNIGKSAGLVPIGKEGEPLPGQFIIVAPGSLFLRGVAGAPQTEQLSVYYYDNGTLTDITANALYSSSNTTVVTVTSGGFVRQTGTGNAAITIGYSGKTINVAVECVTMQRLVLKKSNFPHKGTEFAKYNGLAGLDTGEYIWVQAELSTGELIKVPMGLFDANGFSIINSNPAVAEVGYAQSSLDGVWVKGLNPGATTLFVSAYGLTTACTIEIYDQLAALEVEPNQLTLTKNAYSYFFVHAVYPDGYRQPIPFPSYTSSNPEITSTPYFTNSDWHTIQALADGSTTITISWGRSAAYLNVKVGDTVYPTSVLVSPTTATLQVNAIQQLTATVLPTNATDKTVTWTSSNTTVAAVSASGLVTAKAAGTAVITARTVNGLTATCYVTVIVPRVSFNFSNKGKAGESFNNNFATSFAGNATLTISELKKASVVTIIIKDSKGVEVFRKTFADNGSSTVRLAADSYTVTTKIDGGNGNMTVGVGIVIVGDGL